MKHELRSSEGTGYVSRRSFLKGTAVAGAALAVAGVAGCAPAQTEQGGDAAGAAQQTRWSFETPPDPIAESDIKETVEADVVIVGAGIAGTLAALAAAVEGASVLVLQKSSEPMSHGIGFSVFDAQLQRDAGAEFDLREWTDFFAKDCYGYGNQAYIESVVYNSGRALDMMMDLIKDRGEDFGTVVPYASKGGTICMWNDPDVDRGYSRVPQMIKKLTVVAQELGVEYRFKTAGEQLEKDGDRVAAVIAKGPDGYVRAKGAKGIILAPATSATTLKWSRSTPRSARGCRTPTCPPTTPGTGTRWRCG